MECMKPIPRDPNDNVIAAFWCRFTNMAAMTSRTQRVLHFMGRKSSLTDLLNSQRRYYHFVRLVV